MFLGPILFFRALVDRVIQRQSSDEGDVLCQQRSTHHRHHRNRANGSGADTATERIHVDDSDDDGYYIKL